MIVLNADDYAITEGVSRAIDALADARRLSATSALVTLPYWPALAPRLAGLRDRLAAGLHLNLTLGAPLGPMPGLAPEGRLPTVGALVRASLSLGFAGAEIAAEIDRQLDAFETGLGHPPDHVDGHQHVHVLPGVRGALLDRLRRRYGGRAPLVRDPSDSLAAITARGAPGKALAIRALAAGFAGAAARAGIPTNSGFSGFSDFDTRQPYARELARALARPARCQVVMCHPGFPDAELGRLDPVTDRRQQEYEALLADATLPRRIWHPSRAADGPPIDWASELGQP
ncbi:MAG: ChbG/HpnK family deacetylase [Hyphomicrobiaceae bacterium]